MSGSSPGRPRELDRRRSLDSVPVLNPGVSVEPAGPGRVTLVVRRPRGRGLLARFQPPVIERRVKLDEVGTFVFGRIDGRRPARGIVEEFVRRYRVNRREAELSCAEFLKALMRRQAVAMVVRGGEGANAGEPAG
jgi:hypothetical protein